MAQSLETLFVDLRARTTVLERDLDKANRTIGRKMKVQGKRMADDMSAGFTKSFGKLAAFTGITVGLAGLQAAIRSTVQESSQLQTTADKLGLTTTALQELRYAGSQFNVTTQTTDMALQRFGRRLGEAAQGTGTLKAVLDQYGIAARDSEGNTRGTVAVLRDLADVLHTVKDANEQNRISMQAFDSEGVAFGVILRDGASGLAQLSAEAHAFNQINSSESIRRLADQAAKVQQLAGAWNSLKVGIAGNSLDLAKSIDLPFASIENKLQGIEAKIATAQAMMNRFNPGTANFETFSEDLDQARIDMESTLSKLSASLHQQRETIGADVTNMLANRSTLDPQKDQAAIDLLTRKIERLNAAQAELDATERQALEKYPQMAAYIQELTLATGGQANALALTAEQTARLKTIMASLITPAERYEADLALINRQIEAFPGSAAKYEEAARIIKARYEDSIKPDALNEFSDQWSHVSERMVDDLSHALADGEGSMDRFLDRILKKLKAAAIKSALMQVIPTNIAAMIGLGGADGEKKSPFLFGMLNGFAEGGRPPVGSPYIVGEKGPEIRVDDRPGAILSNHVLRGLSGSGTGGNINIEQHNHFDVGLESVDARIRSAAPAIALATEAAIADRRRRRPF